MTLVLDRERPVSRLGSMTPITPIKAPALSDLKNALQLAAVYGDKDVADSDAKAALGRIQGLIACAIAKLGEPNGAAIFAATAFVSGDDNPRDVAAAILYAAVTGEVGGESWAKALPCPTCDGSGMVAGGVCVPCKGTGIPL